MSKKTKISGKVKFFDKTKGFGFIAIDGNDSDIFFHFSKFINCQSLETDDRVAFEMAEGRDGKSCAVDIEKI